MKPKYGPPWQIWVSIIFILMLFSICLMPGCTYNVSLAHTQGAASDIIDDTSSPTSSISPNLNLSPKAI